jgi:hypothetical protein
MGETLPYQKSPANKGEGLPVNQARLIFLALFFNGWGHFKDWQSVLLNGIRIDNKFRKS